MTSPHSTPLLNVGMYRNKSFIGNLTTYKSLWVYIAVIVVAADFPLRSTVVRIGPNVRTLICFGTLPVTELTLTNYVDE